jgi:Xaa-Pro dipeptidase
VGKPTKHHVEMDEAAREALAAVEEQLRPGRTAGDVFAAHARVLDECGMKNHRLNACGYSLGAKFTPSWMDAPMFYKDNPVVIGPGMVFFAHMILMNSEAGAAFCLGRTYIIGEKKAEPVSKISLEMVVR